MPTEAQVNANRENAEKSTGPRTAEGKKVSSRNAMSHGLSGRVAGLAHDDQLLYTTRLERLLREMQPVTLVEEDLVRSIADSQWQIDRGRQYDQEIRRSLALAEAAHPDTDAADRNDAGNHDDDNSGSARLEALAFRADLEGPGVLDKLARYLARHTRAFYQALREFDLQKKTRLAALRAQAIDDFETSSRTHFNPKEQSISVPNGFDLQKSALFLDVLIARLATLRRQEEKEAATPPLTMSAGLPDAA